MYGPTVGTGYATSYIRRTGTDALRGADILATAPSKYTSQVAYSNTAVGQYMKNIAQTHLAGFGTRVLYTTSPYNGFDTHATEAVNHAKLWTDVSDNVKTFFDDLRQHQASDNVLLFMFSEFGRRIAIKMVRRRRVAVVTTTTQQVNNNRPRRRRRGGNPVRAISIAERALVPVGPPQQRLIARPRLRRRRRLQRGIRPRMSPEGVAFLKCAFAPPDFSVDPGKGIPDRYNGKTIAIKDCATNSISFPANQDTYIVVAPVPGYAYFSASVATGVQPTDLVGTLFPTYSTNFGNATTGDATVDYYNTNNNNFTDFRYASLAAGLYPSTNYMSFSGSISVWKCDMNLMTNTVFAMTTAVTTTEVDTTRLQGLQSITPVVPRDNYTENFMKGAFTVAFDQTGNFEWNPFHYRDNYGNNAQASTGVPIRRLTSPAAGASPLVGFGNTETIIIKVATGATAGSAILKVWNCIEFKARTDTNLYQFASLSPPYDPMALETYSKVRNQLPVAVCCEQNAFSWQRVLEVLKQIGYLGSHIPGPVGMVSGGIGAISEGLGNLLLA
nr:MAG: putative capsid protein precursor [Sichuan mountain noda-like virus 1]